MLIGSGHPKWQFSVFQNVKIATKHSDKWSENLMLNLPKSSPLSLHQHHMFSSTRCRTIGHRSDCRAFWTRRDPANQEAGESKGRVEEGGRRQALPVSNQRCSGVMDEDARACAPPQCTPPQCTPTCARPPVECLKLNSGCFVTSSSIRAKGGVPAKKLMLRRGELHLLKSVQQSAFIQPRPNPPSSRRTTASRRLARRQRAVLVVATSTWLSGCCDYI